MTQPVRDSRWASAAILLALVVGFPRAASANIPLPAAFGFVAPLWMAWLTFGLLFVAVGLIEAIVLKFILDIAWPTAFGYSFGANAISTAFGALFGLGGLLFVAVLLVAILVGREANRFWRSTTLLRTLVPVLVSLVLIVGFFGLLSSLWNSGWATSGWAIYGSLVPAYFVTVLLENMAVRKWYGAPATLRGVVWANLASYALLVALLAIARVQPDETPLQTTDYWSMQLMAKSRQGDMDAVFELLQRMRKIQEQEIGPWFQRRRSEEEYRPRGEWQVAKILISRREYATARQLVTETLQIPRLDKRFRDDFEKLLQEIPLDISISATSKSVSATP